MIEPLEVLASIDEIVVRDKVRAFVWMRKAAGKDSRKRWWVGIGLRSGERERTGD